MLFFLTSTRTLSHPGAIGNFISMCERYRHDLYRCCGLQAAPRIRALVASSVASRFCRFVVRHDSRLQQSSPFYDGQPNCRRAAACCLLRQIWRYWSVCVQLAWYSLLLIICAASFVVQRLLNSSTKKSCDTLDLLASCVSTWTPLKAKPVTKSAQLRCVRCLLFVCDSIV